MCTTYNEVPQAPKGRLIYIRSFYSKIAYLQRYEQLGSSVNIVSVNWMAVEEAEDFSYSLCVQTGSEAHPAS
jgi:hypothetical protein